MDRILPSSADKFETYRSRDFDLAGMKSQRGKGGVDVKPGDQAVYYLTGAMAFGSTAEVAGRAEYGEGPIRTSSPDGELYPHRFPIPLEAADPARRVRRAADLVESMRHTKKWPAEHWQQAVTNVARAEKITQSEARALLHGLSSTGRSAGHTHSRVSSTLVLSAGPPTAPNRAEARAPPVPG